MTKRFIKSLVDTVATKENNSKTENATKLNLLKDKTYPVTLVKDSGAYWLVSLDFNAGTWFFPKSDVTFFYEGQDLNGQLPDFPGGSRVETITAIVEESKRHGLTRHQCAYVLATAEHESNFKPVIEAWWMNEAWRKANLRYWPWVGRGFVQLTWKVNYLKYERITGVPLTSDPNLALRPDVALFVLVHGMKTGSFTGTDLDDWINETKVDFVGARRIVNALDKAGAIALMARKWLDRLTVY